MDATGDVEERQASRDTIVASGRQMLLADARDAAQDAAQHNGTYNDEDGAEVVVIASFGQPEVGDFNYQSE